MKKKKAMITVELVAESAVEEDKRIVEDLLNWFREDVIYIPWVKDVKDVVVKEV
ncbi:MAG: hypothetical protein ACUVTB_04705 [Candidatus Bathycorpusculaceae bacterium]